MTNRRVAICHQAITYGDAVGNDIFGMSRLLTSLGFQVDLLCEYKSPSLAGHNVLTSFRTHDINNYGCVIYHHSIYWELGEELLRAYHGSTFLKFHNITPPEHFSSYSPRYSDMCLRGYAQTSRLIRTLRQHHWVADSDYNRRDLIALGEDPANVSVVPPFNAIDDFLSRHSVAQYDDTSVYYALFVGRIAPNKGHRRLLRLLECYRDNIADNLVLLMVGSHDTELAAYHVELEEMAASAELRCRFFTHVPQDVLVELFRESHVYLSMSEHEGFCVPIIEAQAVGVPVVAMDATAVRSTAGPGQIIVAPPVDEADYLSCAFLLKELFANTGLRQRVIRSGYQNVRSRFVQEYVENSFLEAIMPVLRSAA